MRGDTQFIMTIGILFFIVAVGALMTTCDACAADLAPIDGASDTNTIVVIGSPHGTPASASVSANPAVRELFRTLNQVRADLVETPNAIVAAAK